MNKLLALAALALAACSPSPEHPGPVSDGAPPTASNPFAAAAALSTQGKPGNQTQLPTYSEDRPAVRLAMAGASSAYARVRANAATKQIELVWHLPGPKLVTSSVTLDFAPTDVAAESPGQLLIAGYLPATGEAVIERWTFAAEATDTTEGEAGQTAQASPARPPHAAARELVMRVAGHDPIWALFPVRGGSPRMYALFQHSRGLALLDPIAGTATALAAPIATPGAQLLPGLADLKPNRWSADHKLAGYVDYLGSLGQSPSAILILDRDRDGHADSIRRYTNEELGALELDSEDSYRARF